MKLEFLDDITDRGKFSQAEPDKLLRLYDFDDYELMIIRHLIKRSLIDRDGELFISNLDFVHPINCTLTFQLSGRDLGIKSPSDDAKSFLGQFSKNTYVNMLEIIDYLKDGYNWLYDPSDEDQIDLLLSFDGSW